MDRRGEAVVSRADDDGVECVHLALSSPPISHQMHISVEWPRKATFNAARTQWRNCAKKGLLPGLARFQRLLASAYSSAMVVSCSHNKSDATRTCEETLKEPWR